MNIRKLRTFVLLLVFAAGLFWCAGGTRAQAAVRLNTYKVKLWKGSSAQIYVEGNEKNLPVTWTSSNSTVASVAEGKITANLGGTAYVTAKVGKKKLRCRVRVIGLSRNRVTLAEGQTYSLKVYHATASQWKSTDSSIVRVSSSGKLAAKSGGEAVISCKAGTKTLTVPVYVAELNAYSITLEEGESFLLEKSGTPAKGTWTSNTTSVATVSSSGRVTAVSPGMATVTCTMGVAKLNCIVRVSGINIVNAQSKLPTSSASRLQVSVKGVNGSEQEYVVYNQSSSINKSSKKKLKKFMPYHGCAASATSTVLGGMLDKTVTPVNMIETVEKEVFGTASWRKNYKKSYRSQLPLSLNGITKIFNHYGVKATYVRSFTDAAAKRQILSHLKTGNPVVFVVSKKNRVTGKKSTKWTNSYHTMAMIGVTDTGKVIIADSVNRSSFGSSQRLKVVTIEKILPYMFSSKKAKDSNYWSGSSSCGGYVLVYSKNNN